MLLKIKDGDNWFVVDSDTIECFTYSESAECYYLYFKNQPGVAMRLRRDLGNQLGDLISHS
jgi:hypothetical protein